MDSWSWREWRTAFQWERRREWKVMDSWCVSDVVGVVVCWAILLRRSMI